MEPPVRERYAAASIPNRVFWWPFAYYYKVRLGTVPKLLSWILIYIMPTAFYSAVNSPVSPLPFILNYLSLLLSVFSLYEIGYIHNDTFTTRHEKQPAIRLYPSNLDYFYRHWQVIFLCRLLWCTGGIVFLVVFNGATWTVVRTILSICVILPVFWLYNSLRTRWNVFLYPVLVCSRYVPFLLLYPLRGMDIVLLFLSFPCLNMLERFSMPKYRFPLIRCIIPTEQSKTIFRVIYYSLLLICLVPIFSMMHASFFSLVPIILLWGYRLILWILLKYKTPDNYLQG